MACRRLALALLLALALAAQGLLAQAAAAHRLAALPPAAALCLNGGEPALPHEPACLDHCLAASADDGAPGRRPAHAPAAVGAAAPPLPAEAARSAPQRHGGASPRGPPGPA